MPAPVGGTTPCRCSHGYLGDSQEATRAASASRRSGCGTRWSTGCRTSRHQRLHRPPIGVPTGPRTGDVPRGDGGGPRPARRGRTVPHTMSRVRRLHAWRCSTATDRSAWVEPEVLMDELDDHRGLVRFSYHFTGDAPTEEYPLRRRADPAGAREDPGPLLHRPTPAQPPDRLAPVRGATMEVAARRQERRPRAEPRPPAPPGPAERGRLVATARQIARARPGRQGHPPGGRSHGGVAWRSSSRSGPATAASTPTPGC